MKNMRETSPPNESPQPAKTEPVDHDQSAMSGRKESPGTQRKPSTLALVAAALLSLALLMGGLALASRYGDLAMRAGDASMNRPMTDGTMPMNHDAKATMRPTMQRVNGETPDE